MIPNMRSKTVVKRPRKKSRSNYNTGSRAGYALYN